MGDIKEYYSGWKDRKKEEHQTWKTKNLAIIDEWLKSKDINSLLRPQAVLFRDYDKPKVDFYPSTGRWRIVGGNDNKTYSGGAAKFIEWYESNDQT